MEIWNDVKGYEGLYQVSNLGRVKHLPIDIVVHHEEKILKPQVQNKGRRVVSLWKNNRGKKILVYRLVAEAFVINNDPKRDVVHHKNFNEKDDSSENLEWTTIKENVHRSRDAGRLRRASWFFGEGHPMAKLNTEDVIKIKKRLLLGETPAKICADYKVTRAAISGIKYGNTWRHIK
jgi:hypothetical protein